MDTGKRKRARMACRPCRTRKRKCDGGNPCSTCTDWGYTCGYDAGRSGQSGQQARPRQHARSSQSSPPSNGLARRLEANSGAAFVRRLGLKMDPMRAPSRNLFAWNVGQRVGETATERICPSLTAITSLEHMQSLARVYFDKVDPCYGFIDQARFFARLAWRWGRRRREDGDEGDIDNIYDCVLAGVAAIGVLFSQRQTTAVEQRLVQTARRRLAEHELAGPPSMDLLTAWTLRCVYLRLTGTPHATWMASCTLMHLIEAGGVAGSNNNDDNTDDDLQARVVGVAHHLHAWTSFDLGLARVALRGQGLPRLPAPRPGDYTAELLALLPASVRLDVGETSPSDTTSDATTHTTTDLMAAVARVVAGRHTQPPSVLAQCNLLLCLLRRLHQSHASSSSVSTDWPPGLPDRVLALLRRALAAIPGLVAACCPWHQVAYMPFQALCVLLAMDTRASLALLPQALQTMATVAAAWPTDTLREAGRAARLLVLLHQQRRRDDLAVFAEALGEADLGAGQEAGQEAEEARQVTGLQGREASRESPELAYTSEQPELFSRQPSYAWVSALVAELPSLQHIDLDQLLTMDMLNDASLLGGSG